MNGIMAVVLVFFVLAAGLGGYAFLAYRKRLRRAKAVERGLKMVPLLIHLPPPSDDTEVGNRNLQDVLKEKISQAEVLYGLVAGTAQEGFKSSFYGQRHIAFELVAFKGLIYFYAAVPVAMVSVIQKAVITAYPGARVEEAEDHNIFNQSGRLSGTIGGELVLKHESSYPIQTFKNLERDPMEAIINSLSALPDGEGAAIQFLIRPAGNGWVNRSLKLIKKKRRISTTGFTPKDLALGAIKSPEQRQQEMASYNQKAPLTGVEQAAVEAMEEKTKHPGFETLIRVVVSTESATRSQAVLSDITTAFALYEAPGLNGFRFLPAADSQGLATAFIFRFFPPQLRGIVFNSVELATLFHLPDAQFTPTMNVDRQMSKQVDGPPQLPQQGLLMGYNVFRNVKKEIRLSPEDRRRHTYIIGQTGTGKSTMLENLITQDMLSGNGFAFIDPHGDTAEKLLGLVPKERAEDVIYFNPADMDYPLGLNLFEFDSPEQKDFLIQEAIGMLYKLYDPGHTGIIGPRYEHWFRNAALTLMSDPDGSTFIEIPKVFTDTEYLKRKFRYLQDPTVIEFWTKEMAQTSDYHKSEMLGWFVSKFGAFQNNEMMRNILGQTRSAFSLRDVMDQKKILIVNLSKGRIGELNSQLLGMIFVIKFQAAAMGRAAVAEAQRNDFCLYVDEFQNFSTDSFASILSEARKYRLNLIVANQFIGQLSDEIRDAVFGNIGTIITHRIGPEDAEFMVKQFAPAFEARDLVNIPNYNSVVKLLIGGLPSQPFSMADLPPLGTSSPELGLAVKQLSAAKFGHARQQVAADILARLSGKPLPPPAPVEPAPQPAAPVPTAAATPTVPSTPVAAAPVSESPAPALARTPALPQEPAISRVQAVPAPEPVTSEASQPAPAAKMPDAKPAASGGAVTIQDIIKTGGLMTAPVPAQAAAPQSPAPLTMPPAESVDQASEEAQAEIDELLGVDTLHAPERKPLSQAAPDLLKDQPEPAESKPSASAPAFAPAALPPVQAGLPEPAKQPVNEPAKTDVPPVAQPKLETVPEAKTEPVKLIAAEEHHERRIEPLDDLSRPKVSPTSLQEAEAMMSPGAAAVQPKPEVKPDQAAKPEIKPFDMVTSITAKTEEPVTNHANGPVSAPAPADQPVRQVPLQPLPAAPGPKDIAPASDPKPAAAPIAAEPKPGQAVPLSAPPVPAAKATAPNPVAEPKSEPAIDTPKPSTEEPKAAAPVSPQATPAAPVVKPAPGLETKPDASKPALESKVAAPTLAPVAPQATPAPVAPVVPPENAATVMAAVAAASEPEKPAIPKLEPGEIYVADDGTVYTG